MWYAVYLNGEKIALFKIESQATAYIKFIKELSGTNGLHMSYGPVYIRFE